MNMNKLLIVAHNLLCASSYANGIGRKDTATKKLVSLRELLNRQPELEARGSLKERSPKKCPHTS